MLKKFFYTAKVIFQNNETGILDYVKKKFEGQIDYDEDSFENDFYVNSYNVNDEMNKELEKYLSKNMITMKDITIVSHEVVTDDPYIDLHYTENESNNTYNDSPDIEATLKPILKKIASPQNFVGIMLDKNTIQWKWDLVDLCAYRIYDDEGNIIKELGVNTNTFIEGYLEEGKNYTRKITAFTLNAESEPTEYVTVFIPKPEEKPDTYVNFDVEEKFAKELQQKNIYNGTLKAFQSGVGDREDLKVIPMKNPLVYEKFDFETYVEGIIKKYIKAYTKVNFQYKIIAKCKKLIDNFVNCDINDTAQLFPIINAGMNISGELCIPFSYEFAVNIGVKFKLKNPRVTPKPIFVDLVAEEPNGDIISKDTQVHDSLGYQYKKIRYIKNIPIKGTKHEELILDILHYLKTEDVDVAKSIYDTIEILSVDIDQNEDKNVKITVKENKIYLTCEEHEKIFKYHEYVNKAIHFSTDNTRIPIIAGNTMILKNYLGEEYNSKSTYYNASILPKFKITYDKDFPTDNLYIYDSEYNFSPSILNNANTIYADLKTDFIAPSVNIKKHIETENTVEEKLKLLDLFKDFFQKEGKELKFKKYEIFIKRNDSFGNYEYLDKENKNNKINDSTTVVQCDKNGYITLKCNAMHTYQNVSVESPVYSGQVNGFEPMENDGDGKMDSIISMPIMDIPEDYLEPIFYVKVINNDSSKRITYKFKHGEDDEETTKMNGDIIIFSSGIYKNILVKKTWRGPVTVHKGFELNSIKETEISLDIKTPTTLKSIQKLRVSNIKLQANSLNPNVSIRTKQMYSGCSTGNYKFIAKIISPSQNSWPPYIHAGYYYSNNHEKFLYSNCKPKGEFLKKQTPIDKTFFLNISANIIKKSIEQNFEYIYKTANQLVEGDNANTIVSGNTIKLGTFLNAERKKELNKSGEYTLTNVYFDDVIEKIKVDWEQEGDILCYVQPVLGNSSKEAEWIFVKKGEETRIPISTKTFKIKFVLSAYNKEIPNITKGYLRAYNMTKFYKQHSENVIINKNFIELKDKEKTGFIDLSGPFPNSSNKQNITNLKINIDSNIDLLGDNKQYGDFIEVYAITNSNGEEDSINITNKINTETFFLGNTSFGILIKFKEKSDLKISKISYEAYLPPKIKLDTPILKNISVSSKLPPFTNVGVANACIQCTIPMDGVEHLIDQKTVNEILYPEILNMRVSNPIIESFEIDIEENDIELKYDNNNSDTKIYGTCKTVKTKRITTDYINFSGYGDGYITPIPKLGYPIILIHDKFGSLKHVPESTTKETIISDGRYALQLAYNDIDEDTIVIKNINKNKELSFKKVINNIIYLKPNSDINKNDEIVVTYKVKNSFTVDYNYDLTNDIAKIIVHLSNDIDKDEFNYIKCFYQTEDKNTYMANELQLNPLYTDITNGFIYINDKQYEPSNIDININPSYFICNGKDSGYMYIKVTDKFNNPVPDKNVQIIAKHGQITFKNNVTNISGIVSAKYIAPFYPCNEEITVTCNGISKTKHLEIINEPEDITMIVTPSSYIYRGSELRIRVTIFNQNLIHISNAKIEMIIKDKKNDAYVKKYFATTDADGIAIFKNFKPFVNTENNICTITIMYNGIKEKTEIKVV